MFLFLNVDKPERPPKPEVPVAAERVSVNSQHPSHAANPEPGQYILCILY